MLSCPNHFWPIETNLIHKLEETHKKTQEWQNLSNYLHDFRYNIILKQQAYSNSSQIHDASLLQNSKAQQMKQYIEPLRIILKVSAKQLLIFFKIDQLTQYSLNSTGNSCFTMLKYYQQELHLTKIAM